MSIISRYLLLSSFRYGQPTFMMRRTLALGLIPAIVGLALVSVSHIHGLSDPTRPHTFGEHFVLGQARAGFIAVGLAVLLIVLAIVGWLVLDYHRVLPQRFFWAYISRGPPVPS